MNEQLISFETAKLAKDKGFDLTRDVYQEFYLLKDLPIVYNPMFPNYGVKFKEKDLIIPVDYLSYQGDCPVSCEDKYRLNAPTQSLLQKWLREKHGIHFIIDTTVVTIEWRISFYNVNKRASVMNHVSGRFKTYEEVLEKGLQEALKLI